MVKISITGFNEEPVNETNNDNTLDTIEEEESNNIGTFSGGGSNTWSITSSGYKVYEGQKITLDIHVPTSETSSSAKTYNLYYIEGTDASKKIAAVDIQRLNDYNSGSGTAYQIIFPQNVHEKTLEIQMNLNANETTPEADKTFKVVLYDSTPTLQATSPEITIKNTFALKDVTPTITGTADVGSTIYIYKYLAIPGTHIGTVTADGSGNWSITTSAVGTLSDTIDNDGFIDILVTATDVAGNTSTPAVLKTYLDTQASGGSSLKDDSSLVGPYIKSVNGLETWDEYPEFIVGNPAIVIAKSYWNAYNYTKESHNNGYIQLWTRKHLDWGSPPTRDSFVFKKSNILNYDPDSSSSSTPDLSFTHDSSLLEENTKLGIYFYTYDAAQNYEEFDGYAHNGSGVVDNTTSSIDLTILKASDIALTSNKTDIIGGANLTFTITLPVITPALPDGIRFYIDQSDGNTDAISTLLPIERIIVSGDSDRTSITGNMTVATDQPASDRTIAFGLYPKKNGSNAKAGNLLVETADVNVYTASLNFEIPGAVDVSISTTETAEYILGTGNGQVSTSYSSSTWNDGAAIAIKSYTVANQLILWVGHSANQTGTGSSISDPNVQVGQVIGITGTTSFNGYYQVESIFSPWATGSTIGKYILYSKDINGITTHESATFEVFPSAQTTSANSVNEGETLSVSITSNISDDTSTPYYLGSSSDTITFSAGGTIYKDSGSTGTVTLTAVANSITANEDVTITLYHDIGKTNPITTSTITVVNVDSTTMTITATEVNDGDTSNDATLSLTFTASGATNDFDTSDITVSNGVISNFNNTNNPIFTATFTPSGQGACTIEVAANSFTVSGANNEATDVFNWTHDDVGPTMTLGTLASNNAQVTVTFNEAVNNGSGGNLAASDFVLSVSGGGTVLSSATPTGISKTSDTVYVLTIGYTTDADVGSTLTVAPVTNAIQDAVGNKATASASIALNDLIAPTFTLGSLETDNTEVTVTFSEAVNNGSGADLDVNDFVLSVSGGSAVLSNTTPISIDTTNAPTIYVLGIAYSTNGNTSDTLTVAPASNAIEDAAGNKATASATITLNNPAPTMTITATEVNSGDTSNDATLTLTFTASAATSDFISADISASNGSITDFSGSGTTYNATFTPAGQGACVIEVAAGSFTVGGLTNQATDDFNWTFDSAGPSMTIGAEARITVDSTNYDRPVTNGGVSSSSTYILAFNSNEAINGFAVEDIDVSNGTLSSFSGSGTSYSAVFTPTANGSCTIDVAGNKFTDGAGNNNSAATQFAWTHDATAPSISSMSLVQTSTTQQEVTVTFSENVGDASGLLSSASYTQSDLAASNFVLSISGASGNAQFDGTNPTNVTKISSSVYKLSLDFLSSNKPNGLETLSVTSAQYGDTNTVLENRYHIHDQAGNTFDGTAGTVLLIDNDVPTLSSVDPDNNDTELIVLFTKPVFTNTGGTGDLVAADFDLSLTGGGMTTGGSVSLNSVTKTNDYTYVLGISITYNTSNAWAGTEKIQVDVASNTSVYDHIDQALTTGSPVSASLTEVSSAVSSITLHDDTNSGLTTDTITNFTSLKFTVAVANTNARTFTVDINGSSETINVDSSGSALTGSSSYEISPTYDFSTADGAYTISIKTTETGSLISTATTTSVTIDTIAPDAPDYDQAEGKDVPADETFIPNSISTTTAVSGNGSGKIGMDIYSNVTINGSTSTIQDAIVSILNGISAWSDKSTAQWLTELEENWILYIQNSTNNQSITGLVSNYYKFKKNGDEALDGTDLYMNTQPTFTFNGDESSVDIILLCINPDRNN